METIGDMLLSLTRTSDVACRYNKNHIAIILPFTEKENAQILMSRIQETFEKQDFGISQDTNFVFSILQYTPSDTSKEYIRKAEELLNQ
jgi:PleD family two-component response regulator